MFFVVGANGDHAFEYTISKAGARGIKQIWPPTCEGVIRKNYPKAGIPKGCSAPLGSRLHGHIEGMKSAEVLFDNHLSAMRKEFGEKALRSPVLVRKMNIALYNGGPGRTFTEFRAHGESGWDVPHKGSTIRNETLDYLKKYDFLISHDWKTMFPACPTEP